MICEHSGNRCRHHKGAKYPKDSGPYCKHVIKHFPKCLITGKPFDPQQGHKVNPRLARAVLEGMRPVARLGTAAKKFAALLELIRRDTHRIPVLSTQARETLEGQIRPGNGPEGSVRMGEEVMPIFAPAPRNTGYGQLHPIVKLATDLKTGQSFDKSGTTMGADGRMLTRCIVYKMQPSDCVCSGWSDWSDMRTVSCGDTKHFGFGHACAQVLRHAGVELGPSLQELVQGKSPNKHARQQRVGHSAHHQQQPQGSRDRTPDYKREEMSFDTGMRQRPGRPNKPGSARRRGTGPKPSPTPKEEGGKRKRKSKKDRAA